MVQTVETGRPTSLKPVPKGQVEEERAPSRFGETKGPR